MYVCVGVFCPLMCITPGTPQPSRDEEVCEVKSGDPGLQQRMMLHSGGHASGSRPSQSHTTAKTQAQANAGLGGEGGPMAGRMVMGSKSAVKSNVTIILIYFSYTYVIVQAMAVFCCLLGLFKTPYFTPSYMVQCLSISILTFRSH